mmetsp:Transcript_15422/g.33978  ORF Transcript_15422/g.33978 Transcript_15422/m.33978 type:complete len:201 (+) Transcript_15422:70-672(+)
MLAGGPLDRVTTAWKTWWDSLPTGLPSGAIFSLWALTFRLSGFDQVYLILSIFALLFGPGLGSRSARDRYSAYSIFNRGQRHILGDLRAEQLDAEQRGNHHLADYNPAEGLIEIPDLDDSDGDHERPVVKSRDANRPCPCGSGKKAKRCCFAPPPRLKAPDSRKAAGDKGPDELDPELEKWRSEMQVVATGEAKPPGKRN